MRHSLPKGRHLYGLQRDSLCPVRKKEPYVHYLGQATLRIWRCEQEHSTGILSEILQLLRYSDPVMVIRTSVIDANALTVGTGLAAVQPHSPIPRPFCTSSLASNPSPTALGDTVRTRAKQPCREKQSRLVSASLCRAEGTHGLTGFSAALISVSLCHSDPGRPPLPLLLLPLHLSAPLLSETAASTNSRGTHKPTAKWFGLHCI